MKVHHLRCGSMCPIGGKLFPSILPHDAICHCLLIETSAGLVLVDAGLGVQDLRDPKRLGPMAPILGVVQDEGAAAVNQVKALGFDPRDVRHIIPTHLDLDHAGGIVDFPKASVHTLKPELEAMQAGRTFFERERYRACHFSRDTKWVVHDYPAGEPWFGFDAVRTLPGLPPEIALIPLFGHTAGHFGVAAHHHRGSENGTPAWLLHAGDAYYDHREITDAGPVPIGWKLFQRIVHRDHVLAMKNQVRLRSLARDAAVTVFCAHDAEQFRMLSKK